MYGYTSQSSLWQTQCWLQLLHHKICQSKHISHMLCLISTDAFKLSNDNAFWETPRFSGSGLCAESRFQTLKLWFNPRDYTLHSHRRSPNQNMLESSYYLNMFAAATLLMNRQWWQLWIIFEEHKGINLFLPCGRKSKRTPIQNIYQSTKTIIAFYVVEAFQR